MIRPSVHTRNRIASAAALCGLMALSLAACATRDQAAVKGGPAVKTTVSAVDPAVDPTGPGRGFPDSGPWVAFYAAASTMGDLQKVADTFRIIDIDADPDTGAKTVDNWTPQLINQLKTRTDGSKNRVISYLNVGACETWRSYWTTVPQGFVSCGDNTSAQLGSYLGYADEKWMNVGDPDYQNLILNYLAPRLVAQGVDGFYLDNLEIVAPNPTRPVCDAACSQGGLDLIYKLRAKYPNLLIVKQNANSDVLRLGTTNGVPFPSLLDGVSAEEVYYPLYDPEVESQLAAWKAMALKPGGRNFWVATEDYVGGCTNTSSALDAYTRSRANGAEPYASIASSQQNAVCYWPF